MAREESQSRSIDSSGSRSSRQQTADGSDASEAVKNRWINACFHQYSQGTCTRATCPYLHDLTAKEVELFIAWKAKREHVLFDTDTSGSQKVTDSSLSSSTVKSAEGAALNQHTEEGAASECVKPDWPTKAGGAVGAKGLPHPDPSLPMPSKGSAQHEEGRCKPCAYVSSAVGCSAAETCRFCHYAHTEGTKRTKLRPCKGKRDRYRKLVGRISQQIEIDPDGFNPELHMPPSMESNEVLKAKLLTRMARRAEQVRAERALQAANQTDAASSVSNTKMSL